MASAGRGVSRSEVEELLKESERHTAALFDEVFGRFDELEGRIDRVERRIVLLDKRFDRLELALGAAIPGLAEILGSRLPQE